MRLTQMTIQMATAQLTVGDTVERTVKPFVSGDNFT